MPKIFFSIQLNAPVLLVSYFGGNLLAGQYRIVEQIILVFKTYILLFFNFVYPRICYLVEHEKAKVIKNWLIYNGANFIFVALGMAILFVFSSEAVAYFNTDHPEELSSLLRVAVFLPLVLAISIPLLKVKIDGPEPEIPHPKALFFKALFLTKSKLGINGLRSGSTISSCKERFISS